MRHTLLGRLRSPSVIAVAVCSLAPSARAQLVTTLFDRDGVSLSCVTVGPLAPVAQEYCVRRTLAEGFVRKSELGVSGLTIATSGAADGTVSAVAPGSPAAAAGMEAGDRLISVDGHVVRRTAGSVADELSFGARGQPVRLTLQRAGRPLEVSVTRGPAPEPPGTPRSPNPLIGMHPMVNWEGIFMPCMGVGVLGPAAIGACLSHHGKEGFVRVAALGATGLAFENDGDATALVATVAPGSPAEAAGVKPGDRVLAVEGKPLTASLGASAQSLLFGPAGAPRPVVVDRDGRRIAFALVLGAR